MARLGSYWRWLGHRLRLSQPGRVLFTVALLVGVAGIVVARAHGGREGGAPLVVLALLLAGVVTLDAVGRGVVALVRRLILEGGLRRHS
jgi:cation transporter-like permease